MIIKILAFISILILGIILLAIVGCAKASSNPPLTFMNDTNYNFMVSVNDGTTQLPSINANSGQTYTWQSLVNACPAGTCEMMVSVMDGAELLYVNLDIHNQNINNWEQVGTSDVCIQEGNNYFHLFPGCSAKK